MKYIIWNKDSIPMTAKVSDLDSDYVKKYVIPSLEQITSNRYTDSFLAILHSYARWSYILYNNKLYWLIEWDPGLIVLEFTENEEIRAVALRSPVPDFGGREAIKDIDNPDEYDEDAENPQYNLIFDAWDAQQDEQWQEWNHFEKASNEKTSQFDACLKYANKLGEQAHVKYNDCFNEYYKQATENINKWAGTGIVVK
jgi:hypothetical protein